VGRLPCRLEDGKCGRLGMILLNFATFPLLFSLRALIFLFWFLVVGCIRLGI